MRILSNPKISLFLTLMLLACCRMLISVNVPLYFQWRSSNGFYSTNVLGDETTGTKELYKVNFGLDTLFANGIRTQLELTNHDEKLVSQVVVDHAIIDYTYSFASIQLSMQDFGYGKGFFLNNRRYDNPLYGTNSLINYRWYGVNPAISYKQSKLGFGFAGNNQNKFLSNVCYKLDSDKIDANLFIDYANNDDNYTLQIYHYGYDIAFDFDRFILRSGYVYDHIPKSKFLPEMHKWHIINETKIKTNDVLTLVLSSEHQTQYKKTELDYTNEACLNLNIKRIHSNIGLNYKTLLTEKASTYFSEINVNPASGLLLGVFFDVVDMSKSNDYYKIGFQSSYSF